ncbi:hypothetical protein DICVIV_04661 [Dictyocaulus viviparus]|uniref:Uncharacterized protein n=1 Tax=Dictyocaulus viviparus TaxID=29172 RepID=A0A0D8Y3U1_DICVI|nr:hypothetical protein DICVIV_04661 [Dictyocaulus viviparus]
MDGCTTKAGATDVSCVELLSTDNECHFVRLSYVRVVNVTAVTEDDEKKLLASYPETDYWYRMAKQASKEFTRKPAFLYRSLFQNTNGYPVNAQEFTRKTAFLYRSLFQNSNGYPVNVQVAAPPYREEIVLRLLADIEKAYIKERQTKMPKLLAQ